MQIFQKHDKKATLNCTSSIMQIQTAVSSHWTRWQQVKLHCSCHYSTTTKLNTEY